MSDPLPAKLLATVIVAMSATCPAMRAAEIASNGTGGGAWSDAKTWHGKAVPGPGDDVVIQKHDVVIFDRNDGGKATCRKLLLDPKGVLLLRTGAGKIVCGVADGIESYGVIKLDGTKSASDHLELRLLGDRADRRLIKLNRGGGLLLYGRPGLQSPNVALAAPDVPGLVETEGAAIIDWQRARVDNVRLVARKLDNTGAQPHERCNIIECGFTGMGRILCDACDTPVIAKNTFHHTGAKPIEAAALEVSNSPLAELKGNSVRGGFLTGIRVHRQTDSVLVANTIEACKKGIVGYGLPNLMVKKTLVRGCDVGMQIEAATGVVEGLTVEGATSVLMQQTATLQVNDLLVKDLAAKGIALLWNSGSVKLLNSNVAPEQIKIAPDAIGAKQSAPAVIAQQYLVVAVQAAPMGSLLEVRTHDPKLVDGAADPNVRNSPAPLVGGRTPLPGTLTPLVVRAWSLDIKGTLAPAPEYTVKLLGPAQGGATRPVLKTATYRPTGAVRAPSDAMATLELSAK